MLVFGFCAVVQAPFQGKIWDPNAPNLKAKLQTTKPLMWNQDKSLLHPSEELWEVTPLQLIIHSFHSGVKKRVAIHASENL